MVKIKNFTVASYCARSLLLILAGSVALLASPAPGLAAGVQSAQAIQKSDLKTIIIPVEGMACVACAASVKKTIKSLDGVFNVKVSLEQRTAQVTYTPDKLSPDRFVAAINKLGYRAGLPKEVE